MDTASDSQTKPTSKRSPEESILAVRTSPKEIQSNISNLKLPVPAEIIDPVVARLETEGLYSTVVVLPLRSQERGHRSASDDRRAA